ncbi:MAG: leucine-rich repeat domain-containing protein [Alphaproteobacteria bacterium]|nr:leucine-rich repeat domain-containing protein [Alphaproteobacteria bacterium]
MKKSFLILTLFTTTALASNAFADTLTCGDECTWSFDPTTKTLTVTGTGAIKDFGPEGILQDSYLEARPWHSIASQIENVVISGFTSIGNRAFNSMSNIKSVTLSDTVQDIRYGAFAHMTSLESINIPDSVTNLGKWALQDLPKLQSLSIPSSVTTLSNGVLYGTHLTDFVIPDTITSIETSAFGNYATFKSLVIPDSVTSVGDTLVWGATGTVFCPSTGICQQGTPFRDFYGTRQYYSIDENGVYKIGNTYYASAEDMSHVNCTGTSASSCSLSPIACTQGYDKCKEEALAQMAAKGSLCTTIQGCQNLIAMVSDSNYNCTSLTTCRNAVKNHTYDVDLSEGAVAAGGGQAAHVAKRIYTVEEARAAVEAAGTDTVNFRIRYK